MPKNTLAACRQYIAMHNTAAARREKLLDELYRVSERQSKYFGLSFDNLPDGFMIRLGDQLELVDHQAEVDAKHLAERAPTAYDFTAVGSYDYVDYDPGMEPYNR